MKDPLPFSITIHGIAYSDTNWAMLTKRDDLFDELEAVVEKHLRDDVTADLDVVYHIYRFRAEVDR